MLDFFMTVCTINKAAWSLLNCCYQIVGDKQQGAILKTFKLFLLLFCPI